MGNYHRCFIEGCSDYKKEGTSFHKFPTETKNAKKWCYLIKTINNQSNAYNYKASSLVCGWHFSQHHKKKFGKWVKLYPDAVPTLFEGYDDDIDFDCDESAKLCEEEAKFDNDTSDPSHSTSLENMYESLEEMVEVESANPEEASSDKENSVYTSNFENDNDIIMSPLRKRRVEQNPSSSSTKRFRYFGDFKNLDLNDSEEKSRALDVCRRTILSAKKKIKYLHQKVWRKNQQICTMKDMLKKLEEKFNLSSDAVSHLSMNYSDEIIIQLANGKRTKEYTDEVKAFACTLNFYSAAAYEYIRTKFGKNLPSQSTIRSWYKSVDGSTGVSELAMNILKDRVADKEGGKVFVSFLIDEMAIRVLKFWNNSLHKWEGLVDFGNEYITSDDTPASKVLVFLGNEINGSGKVPVAHYFTHNVNGEMLRTLVLNALEELHKTGVTVMSLTFDGPQPNITMAHLLGGNVWNPDDLRCTFPHPITKEPVFLFLDVVHMVKLIRNTLGSKGIIYDDEKKAIRWQYIVELVKLQEQEKLSLATKIRQRHIKYSNEKMKVKLAVQVFSESVAAALEYCLAKNLPQFVGCEATIRFIRMIDKLFDILNSRNLTAPGYKKGISYSNFTTYFDYFDEASIYIRKLTTNKKASILKSQSRTGFIGFLTAMDSTKKMYNLYVREKKDLKFLLMYHFTQDPLETLFCVIRGKRGADNNVSTMQFKGIWKRLLMYNEIRRFNRIGNTADDKINLFTAKKCVLQINKNSLTDDEMQLVNAEIDCQLDDEDFLGTVLTEVTMDIVVYIAGFVERKLKKQIKCHECINSLNGDSVTSDLIKFRDKGGLLHPHKDVVVVCKEVEKLIRFLNVNDRYFYEKVRVMCFRAISSKNVFDNMTGHILEQTVIDNHKTLLISAIVDFYVKIRMHHEGKRFCEELKSSRVRSKNSKLTLFAGQ